jgi:hypothetical protein
MSKATIHPFFDQYWFRFLIGGFVVATTATLAASVNTKLAAILWSAPITLLPTLLFLWHQQVPPKRVADFTFQTVLALGNLMIFSGSLAYFMKQPYFINMKNGILWATLAAVGLWAIGSAFLYFSVIGPF